MAKKRVWLLPEDLVLPMLAAVRLLEKSMNPAFDFVLRCNQCGQMNVQSVASVKDKDVTIGIACNTEGCGEVIKFERKLDRNDSDFPARLQKVPDSALTPPAGKTKKTSPKWIADAFRIVLGGDDE